MKRRIARTSPVVAAIALAALTLGACGAGEGNGNGTGNGGDGGETTTSAPVSVDPAAPQLTEREGAYNFIRSGDDGRTYTLAHVKVMSSDGWLGLADDEGQYTALENGEYKVVARGESGCSGAGATSDEGLGVIGEIHVDGSTADIWSTPVQTETEYLTTVALVDGNDEIVACGRAVSWTEPTETETTGAETAGAETTSATTSATRSAATSSTRTSTASS